MKRATTCRRTAGMTDSRRGNFHILRKPPVSVAKPPLVCDLPSSPIGRWSPRR
jgi:hypothetical protein